MIARLWFTAALIVPAIAAQMPAPPPQVPTAPRAAVRPVAAARPTAASGYKDLKYPAARPLEPLQPVRFQLPNGLKVLLLEDHEKPMVSAAAIVRTGSVYDPPERAGLASMAGALLRNGGSAKKTPERLDSDLDGLAATIDSSIGETMGTVRMTALKGNLAEALVLFRDVLTSPDFRHDRIDRARSLAVAAISRRNDDPRLTLVREFRRTLYGRDTPLTRLPELATVGRIGRPDIVAFYRRYFFPANVVLTLSGDFDAGAMKGAVESLFGSWKNDQEAVPEIPRAGGAAVPGAFVAYHPALKQTHFAVGLTVADATVQDRAALELVASILGGGFESRLIRRARQDLRGAAEIRAEWAPGAGGPGVMLVSGVCQSGATGDTVQAIVEEIRRLGSAEAGDDEFRAARESALVHIAAPFEDRAQSLAALAGGEYYGYPAAYASQVYSAIAAVSRGDVLRLARERLQPEKLTVFALSNLAVWPKPLDPGGAASKTADIAIPQAQAEFTAATTATADLARQILQRAQQAVGGIDKLMAVKDFTQSVRYDVADGNRESQTDRWIAPTHLRQDAQSTKVGALYRYADGTSGWLSNGRGSTALTGLLARDARSELLRVYFQALLSDRLPGRTVVALDEETVEIVQGDVRTQVVFDPQTGLMSKLLYEVQLDRQLPIFVEEEYSDFREVDGIKVPFGITVTHNGSKYSTGQVTEFKINQGLKIEVLQRRP